MKSKICYRSVRDDDWRTVNIISRGGKAAGKYKNLILETKKQTKSNVLIKQLKLKNGT